MEKDSTSMAVDERINTLRQFYLVIGEAISALKEVEQLRERAARHKKAIQEKDQKIGDLTIIIKGLETVSGKRVEICPECLGAGAYVIKEEVEECDKCSGNGWIEKI